MQQDNRLSEISFYQVTSTMDAAASIIARGDASPFTAIHACIQTQGRGRQGRSWETPEDAVMVTLAIKVDVLPERLPQLSFVGAVGAHKALQPFLKTPLILKWPNDFLIRERKVGGILIEIHHQKDSFGRESTWAVLGLGFNYENVPPHFRKSGTNLSAHWKHRVLREDLVQEVLKSLLKTYDQWCQQGFPPLRDYWMSHCLGEGKLISFHQPDGQRVEGYSLGIDEQGLLLLRTIDGEELSLSAGDIILGSG